MQKKVKGKKRIVAGALLGTVVEYYDYSLYGWSAAILALKFFPEADKLKGLSYVFIIYALSYVPKPLGSTIFSYIGDHYGRSVSLRITIIGIAIPTFIIGILPDFHSIGIASTYILFLCKFTQGFFVGGEYDGAAIYVIEHLGKKYHYTASAVTRSIGVLGLLLGIASVNFFNSSIFPDWSWRLPFLLALPLALLTIYCRRYLVETPDFSNVIEKKIKTAGITNFIRRNSRILLMVIFLAGGFGATYQLSVIFMKQYLPISFPNIGIVIKSFSILVVFIFGISMPIAGFCADKFGTLNVIRCSSLFTLIASALISIGITYEIMNLVLISVMILAASVAPFNALAHGIIIKAFPVTERYRGVSLGHTIGSMLMSGTANVIALHFIREYKIILFPLMYITFFTLVSFFVISYFLKKHD